MDATFLFLRTLKYNSSSSREHAIDVLSTCVMQYVEAVLNQINRDTTDMPISDIEEQIRDIVFRGKKVGAEDFLHPMIERIMPSQKNIFDEKFRFRHIDRSLSSTENWIDFTSDHTIPYKIITKYSERLLLNQNFKNWLPPVYAAIVDNGPDFAPASTLVIFYFGLLWMHLDFDIMWLISFSAYWSALNPIEHLWGPHTKNLAGQILSVICPGDELPPCKMPHLSDEELLTKEFIAFKGAMMQLAELSEGVTWRGVKSKVFIVGPEFSNY